MRRFLDHYHQQLWLHYTGWWLGITAAFWCSRLFLIDADLLTEHIIRGMLSDVVIAGVIAAILALIPSSAINSVLVFVLGLLIFGNAEHILVNLTNAQVMMWEYAADETFLRGSLLTTSNMLYASFYWLAMVSIHGICVTLYYHRSPIRSGFYPCALWLLVVIITVSYPVDDDADQWIQTNAVEENLIAFLDQKIMAPSMLDEIEGIPSHMAEFYQKNLSGSTIVNDYTNQRPNILMIVVESLSEAHVKSGWMPNLYAIQQQSLHYNEYIIPANKTINGLFSLFCGDYPELFVGVNAVRLTRKTSQRPCLAEMLDNQGYNTMFQQAASLSYAQKNRLLNHSGFSKTLGRQEQRNNSQMAGWGLMDHSLYQKTFEHIQRLSAKKAPWFLSVLNVGTHPPYEVPEHFKPDMKPAAKRGYLFADQEIGKLYRRLSHAGLLNNTIIIITSDEVRLNGLPRRDRQGHANHHGYLIVHMPNHQHQEVSGAYLQQDLPLSIADLLGLSTHGMFGRSVFREYTQARSYFFADTYKQRLHIKIGNQTLISCNRRFTCEQGQMERPNLFRNRGLLNVRSANPSLARDIIRGSGEL